MGARPHLVYESRSGGGCFEIRSAMGLLSPSIDEFSFTRYDSENLMWPMFGRSSGIQQKDRCRGALGN